MSTPPSGTKATFLTAREPRKKAHCRTAEANKKTTIATIMIRGGAGIVIMAAAPKTAFVPAAVISIATILDSDN